MLPTDELKTTSRLLRASEVCRLLAISPNSLERLVASGRLEAFRVGPRSLRVASSDLAAFLEHARAAKSSTTPGEAGAALEIAEGTGDAPPA